MIATKNIVQKTKLLFPHPNDALNNPIGKEAFQKTYFDVFKNSYDGDHIKNVDKKILLIYNQTNVVPCQQQKLGHIRKWLF